jgi:hypothetical protein
LEIAGKEIVTAGMLSAETQEVLEQPFIPIDIYNQQVNAYFDSFLCKLEHPYMKG